jgi:flagellar biosynthesis protein FliQ
MFEELASEGLYLILLLSIGPLLVSLIVGLIISLFQALTQIQEQTLTFVPKAIATTLVIMLLFGTMITTLVKFMKDIFDKILDLSLAP